MATFTPVQTVFLPAGGSVIIGRSQLAFHLLVENAKTTRHPPPPKSRLWGRWRTVKGNKMSLWGAFRRLVLEEIVPLVAEPDLFNCAVLSCRDVADPVGCLANNRYPVFLGLAP